jgi:hypothetical protein
MPERKIWTIQQFTPELREAAAIKQVEAALATNPHLFERVNDRGEPDPNGTHWQYARATRES